MRNRVVLVTLIIASSFVTGLSFQMQPRPSQQWEYRQTCRFDDANKLGADGWEMVTATGGSAVTCFYFKRQK